VRNERAAIEDREGQQLGGEAAALFHPPAFSLLLSGFGA
jgi:hypothetical protein